MPPIYLSRWPLWKTQKFVDAICALYYCVEDLDTLRLRSDWTQVLEWCCNMQWYDIQRDFICDGIVERMQGQWFSEDGSVPMVRPERLTDAGLALTAMARIAKSRE